MLDVESGTSTVMITGARGYIGAELCPVLRNAGYKVVGLDTNYYKSSYVYGYPTKSDIVINKDLRDIDPHDFLDHKIQHVVHLAALSNDPLGQLDESLTHNINFRGSLKLIRLARDYGVNKFIFASSCSVYGDSSESLVNENSKINPLTEYARSKAEVEHELRYSVMPYGDFCPVILRNATAYGQSFNFRSDLVVNDLLCSALSYGKIVLKSTGNAWRPVVNVHDICNAIRLALREKDTKVNGQIFNVGENKHNFKIIDIAKLVSQVTDAKIEIQDGAVDDQRSYCVDFSKFKRTFGYTCRSFPADIVLFANWLTKTFGNGNLRDKRFVRLEQLKELREYEVDENLRWNMCKEAK